MPKLPITSANVFEWFPAPHTENPFAGHAWWQVQSLGLLAAIQLLRLLPDTDARQQALLELRRAFDTGLLDIQPPPDEEVQRRLAQTLAPYVPTPFPIVDAMLALAGLAEDDVLIDLGSGDGRVVLEAARRGARAVGIEIDAALVSQSIERRNEDTRYLTAEFLHGDVLDADISQATVVTCYLLSTTMGALTEKFRALKPGTRIISHAFVMPEWAPTRTVRVGESLLFLWVV